MIVKYAKTSAIAAVLLIAVSQAMGVDAKSAATAPWASKDTQGRAVSVPAETTSVLVFMRPDQPQSVDEIAQLGQMLKDRKDVQVIGIVSGDDAEAGAAKMAGGGKWPWVMVADGNYAASGKYEVHVWPTTVIINKAGEQVAHVPGLPASFEGDVSAYLDYASGRIDQAALGKRLADRGVVVDTTDQKASRHVEVALRLAEQGMKEAALAEVGRALELKPTDPGILLSIARTDLIAESPEAAERVLGALADGVVPAAQLCTLKGWCAVEKGQWAEARKQLEQGTQLNPEPAEAFYLYGVVMQHDGDQARAAEYFRKAFEHTEAGKVIAVESGK